MVRSSVIEELGEDYVRTARAKGLSETQVVYKHVLKNGLDSGRHYSGTAAWNSSGRRNHHREDIWLARAGTTAGGRRNRQTRLPRSPGMRSGNQHHLHRRQHADRHDLPLARSSNTRFLIWFAFDGRT